MEDKVFRIAIIVSLLIHVGMFVRFYIERKEINLNQKPLEVSYQIEKKADEPNPSRTEVVIHNIEDIAPDEIQVQAGVPQNIAREDQLFKDRVDISENFKIYERKPEKIKGMKVTKEVSMPVLRSEKINTPAYVTYYQIVRDRIRDRAYTNFTKLSVGEVYLTFIVGKDGSLGQLQIIEDKTTANEFLRDVGVQSVQEAAPFPVFPEDLSYPELTFNVAISFQYREE